LLVIKVLLLYFGLDYGYNSRLFCLFEASRGGSYLYDWLSYVFKQMSGNDLTLNGFG